jgi:hypothetical protein
MGMDRAKWPPQPLVEDDACSVPALAGAANTNCQDGDPQRGLRAPIPALHAAKKLVRKWLQWLWGNDRVVATTIPAAAWALVLFQERPLPASGGRPYFS